MGLFLYVVVLTGTVAVFSEEIGTWSSGGKIVPAPLDFPIDRPLTDLSKTIDAKYLEEVSVSENPDGSLTVFFHTHAANDDGLPDELGVRFIVNPVSFEVLERHEGLASEMPGPKKGALADFISELHINLYMSDPWGLYLTGVLGFVMLMAVISGIILHKHILKDLFTSPRFSSLLLNRRDRHILAGSWSLPFGFILAFTGSFFSFGGALGLPIVAMVAFGGDQVKMIETVIGVPETEDSRPASMTNIDKVLSVSKQQSGSTAEALAILHWGKADSSILVTHGPFGTSPHASHHIFNGVTGEYQGPKPELGKKPSLGNDVFGLMHALHFGDFAGMLSKIIWFSLGLATCYVSLTGLQLWLTRRAESQFWARLSRAVPIVGYGTPLSLGAAAIAYFLTVRAEDTVFWTGTGFLLMVVLSLVIGVVVVSRSKLSEAYLLCLGGVLFALPVMRIGVSDASWIDLLTPENIIVIAFDIFLLVAGALTIVCAKGWHAGVSKKMIGAGNIRSAE